ncbi:hypothetical protein ABZP36_034389 [Zizania latifolia]
MMVLGLAILEKLSTNKHNCATTSNAVQGLLPKIMAPVSSDMLHRIGHDALYGIVNGSLKVMCRLVTAPGETGIEFRRAIASNKEAVGGMEMILNCKNCTDEIHMLAIKILTQLPVDASSNEDIDTLITNLLVTIFTTDENKDNNHITIRKMAGEALAMLSDKSESNAAAILKATDTVVGDLCRVHLHVEVYDNYAAATLKATSLRIIAAEILEHVCIRYTQDDYYLKILKKATKDVMPQVFAEIFILLPSGIKKIKPEPRCCRFEISNIEEGQLDRHTGTASQDNGQLNTTPSRQQHAAKQIQAALLSLSAAVFDKLIIESGSLAEVVDTISPRDSVTSFAGKLKEMVEKNSEPTANCLRILKITSRMVTSMLENNGSYVVQDLEGLVESLSRASDKMVLLEGLMIVGSSDHGGTMKPPCTLHSLVKKARELLDKKKKLQAEKLAIMPAT